MSDWKDPPKPFVVPPSNASIWENYDPSQHHSKVWKPFIHEYHLVLGDPKRLPILLQPFLSKEPAFALENEPSPYLNVKLDLADKVYPGVRRRVYLQFNKQNLVVGALGATMIGIGSRNLLLPGRLIRAMQVQKSLLENPSTALRKFFIPGGAKQTVGFYSKCIVKAAAGGLSYDSLKRSQELSNHFDEENASAMERIKHAGIAGGASGLLLGSRGGTYHAAVSSLLFFAGAVLSEFISTSFMSRNRTKAKKVTHSPQAD